MKRLTWFLSALWVGIWQTPNATAKNWVIGNGGDGLRLVFEKAKENASFIAVKMREDMLTSADPLVRNWILKNKDALASDILQSELQWVMEEKPTCAWTTRPSLMDKVPTAAAIELSFPTCRSSINNFVEATELLLHESVHHFGIDDETFADQVALAIVQGWTNGGMHWHGLTTTGAPSARKRHAAVWTGTEMIVIGGLDDATLKNVATPFAYDPQKDRWRALAATGAPARNFLQAVWTGKQLIAWGGFEGSGTSQSWQYNGAIWNPATDSWVALKSPQKWKVDPSATFTESPRQTAIWTGSEVLIFGGSDTSGNPLTMAYNPETAAWRRLSTVGSPERLAGHTAVWTGDEMIVWGGYVGDNDQSRILSADGAIYDLRKDEWRALPSANSPKERYGHVAVWTGDSMIVFGGRSSRANIKGTGGIYNSVTRKWEAMESEIALERWGHSAAWTGKEMLVMGGAARFTRDLFGNVLAFDQGSKSWKGMSSLSAPAPRMDHTAVWTGNSLIIWGGSSGFGQSLKDGAIFYP